MSESIEKNILGTKTAVTVPQDAEDALITEYGEYLDFVKMSEQEFMQKKDKFYTHTLQDKALEDAAAEWEKAGALLIGYAQTLFNLDANRNDLRKYALELMDKATKAAGLCVKNLEKHRERVLAADPEKSSEEARMTRAKNQADSHLIRAINTQRRYIDLYENGECYANAQHQEEAELSARVEEMRKLVPEGHIHIPGRIYPPVPIPPGERVPVQPQPYQMYMDQPVEAMMFDEELDEFVLKPGYVSPDGLIDENSVIRDRKNHQVIMKFRGGEPVIWPEWKATWTGDVMDGHDWGLEYLARLGRQLQEDDHMELFHRQPYEDEVPWYDQIPENRQ